MQQRYAEKNMRARNEEKQLVAVRRKAKRRIIRARKIASKFARTDERIRDIRSG